MRCKFCNERLRQTDYEWDEELQEFMETGVHRDVCLFRTDLSLQNFKGPDAALDPSGYDYLSDFEE